MLVLALADDAGTTARSGRSPRSAVRLRIARRPHPAAGPADDRSGGRGFWPRRGMVDLRPRARVGHRIRGSGGASATGSCSGPGPALVVTVARVLRRRARPARVQGRLLDHERSSRSTVESVERVQRAAPRPSRPGTLAPTDRAGARATTARVTAADVAAGRRRSCRARQGRGGGGARPRALDATARIARLDRHSAGRPVQQVRARHRAEDARRRREPAAGRHGPGRRRQRDQLRLRQRQQARPAS